MTISTPSIKKLFREHFPGEEPLRLPESERKALVAALRQRFEGDDWVDTEKEPWMYRDRQDRHLQTLTLKDPERFYYSDSFHLMLDDVGRIVIESSGLSATVSGLDEIVSFVLECKRRLERQRALRARRKKVRGFKHAAAVAQLKEMAHREKFDFTTDVTPQRIKIWIRLNERDDALEIFVAPKRFQDLLPRLPALIGSLKASWEAGLSFKTVSRRALPWGVKWIRHGEAREDSGHEER